MEKFLTAEQVAELMQVHLGTVRVWLRSGQLRGVKVGRAWRVPESAIRALSGSTSSSEGAPSPNLDQKEQA